MFLLVVNDIEDAVVSKIFNKKFHANNVSNTTAKYTLFSKTIRSLKLSVVLCWKTIFRLKRSSLDDKVVVITVEYMNVVH